MICTAIFASCASSPSPFTTFSAQLSAHHRVHIHFYWQDAQIFLTSPYPWISPDRYLQVSWKSWRGFLRHFAGPAWRYVLQDPSFTAELFALHATSQAKVSVFCLFEERHHFLKSPVVLQLLLSVQKSHQSWWRILFNVRWKLDQWGKYFGTHPAPVTMTPQMRINGHRARMRVWFPDSQEVASPNGPSSSKCFQPVFARKPQVVVQWNI